MSEIQYIQGDATRPLHTAPTGASLGNEIIVHICNNWGVWGKGFVLAVSARWPEPEAVYRQVYEDYKLIRERIKLGRVDLVKVEDGLWVANMIAQNGLRSADNPTPINYIALQKGLAAVRWWANDLRASVHMPRIGSGLAGGNWKTIETLIKNELIQYGIQVYVYDKGK